MGKRVMCITTLKTVVMQGDANTTENRCITTPPLKGRGWGWCAHHLFGAGWGSDLVPMSRFPRGTVGVERGLAFALPKKSGGDS